MTRVSKADIRELAAASVVVTKVRRDLASAETRVREFRGQLQLAETQLDNAIRRVTAKVEARMKEEHEEAPYQSPEGDQYGAS